MVTKSHVTETAFHDEISAVFAKYPEMRHTYVLASLALPLRMGIDFDQQIGVCRIDGNKIIVEFQDRDEDDTVRMRHCDIRTIHGECLAWSGELPK
ncbi:hypothetical protein [Streptomyces sp.]|uniref:hypothetical protein n=1 Tax=Streptomyces sp. TaxID=1931 RepID=UPI002F3EF171